MENYKVVMPEHLNHFGCLFGGNMLKWVDEISWIAAHLDYPNCQLLTIAMDRVEFRESVRQGAILRFHVAKVAVGDTSVTYAVDAFSKPFSPDPERQVFSTRVTFVRVGPDGKKLSLPRSDANG